MASISEIQGVIAAMNVLVMESVGCAVQAATKAQEAKAALTRVMSDDDSSALLGDCQVGLTRMIEACQAIAHQAGEVTEKAQRFSDILSA